MPIKGNILLLENDPDFRAVLKEWLESEGYKVFAASSVSEAEEQLAIKNLTIHLIITDLRVTDDDDEDDFSGLMFARMVAPAIPKIIMTAYAGVRVVREALSPRFSPGSDQLLPAPAIAFLQKTEGIGSLLQAVEEAFRTLIIMGAPEVKVGGALTNQDAASYIERKAEKELIRHIQDMDYILIIEPRQQGKTSLINYAMRHPNLKNTKILYVDTTTLDYSTQEGWYKTIRDRILNRLGEVYSIEEWPDAPKNNIEWRQFLCWIARTAQTKKGNLIIALDEIGAKPIPGATDFFTVIRDIYNSRQGEPEFFHISFLLVGSFHPRDLITDDKVSPFNIAIRVRLDDFNQVQIYHMVRKPTWSDEHTNKIVEQIFYWTHGQPYLTQKLCEQLRLDTTIDHIDTNVRLLQQEDSNHLPSILKTVSNDSDIRSYTKRILSGEKIKFFPAANKQQAKMELIGILKSDNDGHCKIRNQIYERAFCTLLELSEEQVTDHQKDKIMIAPEQQIAMQILKEAFSFVASELKQRWKSKREKPEKEMPANGDAVLGISESLQSVLVKQLENIHDESQLKMLTDNLKTAIVMAEKYNKRWNKYREQLPSAMDTVAIEMQIDDAEHNREKAVKEIKAIFEMMAKEEITIS